MIRMRTPSERAQHVQRCDGGGAGEILRRDTVAFAVRSDGLPKVERQFQSLMGCAEECGASRVYAGIHYRFSCDDGIRLGQKVAEFVLSRP